MEAKEKKDQQSTLKFRAWVKEQFAEYCKEDFKKDLEALLPSERVKVFTELIPYAYTKQKKTEEEEAEEAEFKELFKDW